MTLRLSEREIKESVERITANIAGYVEDANANGVVVAFSGGLDSAVVLALAAKSGVDVKALLMPETGVNKEEDLRHAESYAKKLGVVYEVIPIEWIADAVEKAFPWSKFPRENIKLGKANIRPRTRMILNYLAANLDDRIVLGTGNKTELALGYFTKYGDGGVDVLPIGSLYKTQVRQVAQYIGVPKKIIDKPPSAGLWQGQTDEGELGITYEQADRILYALIDEGKTVDDACKSGADREEVDRISGRVKANRHKCGLPPIL
ncbi:MAG: NAD+ synthase [Candidatus Altiarchaeota archaeon]